MLVNNIAAYIGDRRTSGWILVATSAVAFADGFVCWTRGGSEWNHWGYAPMVNVLGSLSLGILDQVE